MEADRGLIGVMVTIDDDRPLRDVLCLLEEAGLENAECFDILGVVGGRVAGENIPGLRKVNGVVRVDHLTAAKALRTVVRQLRDGRLTKRIEQMKHKDGG